MNRLIHHKQHLLSALALIAFSPLLAETAPTTTDTATAVTVTTVNQSDHWSYHGDKGPDKWAELAPQNKLCASGKNQSPVNIIRDKLVKAEPRGIKFNYGHIKPQQISFDGKSISVYIAPGTGLNADGIDFELKRLDIHIPSEHTIDGKHYPMEIQLLHQNNANQQANVAMMVLPGKADRALAKLIAALPAKAGEHNPLADNALRTIEMKKKLATFYRYNGSSTTPPCNEGVRWFVMKQALSASKAQYDAFRDLLKKDNNRPVQALNARIILEEL